MSGDGANGSLPRWVESLDRRLEQGLASCAQAVSDLRVELSGEIKTLRAEGERGRDEMHKRLGEIERTGSRRLTDLETWRAARERMTGDAPTAAVAVPSPPGRMAVVRDVLSKPWPWLAIVVALSVGALVPGAWRELGEFIASVRGG